MNDITFIIKQIYSLSDDLSKLKNKQIEESQLYKNLYQIVKKHKIIDTQINSMNNSILLTFLLKKSYKANASYNKLVYDIIQYIYNENKESTVFIYQLLPMILTKYIQISNQPSSQQSSNCVQYLQKSIRLIYNKQHVYFNQNLKNSKKDQILSLYKQHFNKTLKQIIKSDHLNELQQQDEINSSNKIQIKCVLLYSIFNNLSNLCEKSIITYLWMVYIFCGGQQQQDKTGVSLYLLQKKNKFSIFKYYISEQQVSLILITLYQLSIQRKNNKFQIYSTINMIHKKTANQCMFKLSQVTQSMIHLLEDQYNDAFQ